MWTWDRKNVNNKEKAETEERYIPGSVTKDKLSVADKAKILTGFAGKVIFDALGFNSKHGVNNLDEVEEKERENALRDREEPIVDTREINDMASDAANYSDVIETIYQKNLYSK